MGFKEGDPWPCTGTEPAGVAIKLDEHGDPLPDSGIVSSACFADWYYGADKWVWRPDTDPDNPPADSEPPGPAVENH